MFSCSTHKLNPPSTLVFYLFKTYVQSLSSHLMSFCDSCCRWFPFSLSCCVSLFLPCLPLPSVFPCSSRVFLILPLSPNKLHPLIFLRAALYICFHLLHSHHERRFGIEGGLGAIQMSQYPTNRWVTAYDWQKWEVTTTSIVYSLELNFFLLLPLLELSTTCWK